MERILNVTAATFDVATPKGKVVVKATADKITVQQVGKKGKTITRPDGDHSMNIGTNRVRKLVENYFTPKKI